MTRLVGPELTHSAARRCKAKTAFASDVLCLTKKRAHEQIEERGLRGVVALGHGDVALMGGWFQRDFEHCTVPADKWAEHWSAGSSEHKRCRFVPDPSHPRINVTGRFVRAHGANCPVLHTQSRLVGIPSLPPAPGAEKAAEEMCREIQRLQEEIQRLQREEELARKMKECQAELLAKDEELAVGATGDQERLERDRRIRAIADVRTRKLRSSSHRVAAEVALQVKQRIQELMRFAIYECAGTDDDLFIHGWLENPLVVRPPPHPPGPRLVSLPRRNFERVGLPSRVPIEASRARVVPIASCCHLIFWSVPCTLHSLQRT